jgi:hypothetical protein
MGADEQHPGWEVSSAGTLTLTVEVAGEHLTLATVTQEPESGLFRTYIGIVASRNQLGRHDASQERAVRKAEDFLLAKLRHLLLPNCDSVAFRRRQVIHRSPRRTPLAPAYVIHRFPPQALFGVVDNWLAPPIRGCG